MVFATDSEYRFLYWWYAFAKKKYICHNLDHMAPFGIPTAALCMVLRHATSQFVAQGTIFRTWDSSFGQWSQIGPRRNLGEDLSNTGYPQNKVVLVPNYKRSTRKTPSARPHSDFQSNPQPPHTRAHTQKHPHQHAASSLEQL